MVAGTKNSCTWDYSERSDTLNVHQREKQVRGSTELGDCTIDFGKDGNIAGIEVAHAADFFTQIGIEQQPTKLRGAEIVVQHQQGVRVVVLKLYFAGGKSRMVPMPMVAHSMAAWHHGERISSN